MTSEHQKCISLGANILLKEKPGVFKAYERLYKEILMKKCVWS